MVEKRWAAEEAGLLVRDKEGYQGPCQTRPSAEYRSLDVPLSLLVMRLLLLVVLLLLVRRIGRELFPLLPSLAPGQEPLLA